MDNLRKFIAVCFCILIVCMTYLFVQIHELIKQTKTEIREVHDTIVQTHTDSFFILSPIVYKVKEIRTDTEAVWSPLIEDSVLAELPYIQKEYRDSTYSAWVSGYLDVNLDSIEVFLHNKIVEINNQIERIKYKNRPFSLGIQVGYGFDFMNKQCSPYIGLGISYNIINFGKR